jgi:hypothetical protein
MTLKSFDTCPFCMHRVVLHKDSSRNFLCPDCNCEFRHNFVRWLPVAIPAALAVVLMLYEFTHQDTVPSAIIYALIGVAVAAAFLTPFPAYSVMKPGRPEMDAERDEST